MGLLFHEGMGVGDRQTAEQAVALLYDRMPDLAARYGAEGRRACVDDAYYTLLYLAASADARNYGLFREYVGWAKGLFARQGLGSAHMGASLTAMRDVLATRGMDEQSFEIAFIEEALGDMDALPTEPPPVPLDGSPQAGLARDFLARLRRGDRNGATRLVLDAAETGTSVQSLYLDVLQPCLREVGRLWQTNELSVAEEHFFTAATQMIIAQLYPFVFNRAPNGRRMVAVCANGELHEIGMRMIADLFEMDGWDTLYLGASVPDRSVIQMVKDRDADLLAVSVTIAVNLPAAFRMIDALRADPECRHVKVLIGGMPFNLSPGLWRRTQADAWAPDALGALSTANALIEGRAVDMPE